MALRPFDSTDTLDKPCYDYKGLSRASAFLDDLAGGLRAVGVDVYQIDHEDANGQFEVNYTYADALTSADNFMLVKMAVSEIARKHGMIGTLHAQALLEPHGQRRALPYLDRQRHGTQPVPWMPTIRRGCSCRRWRYFFVGGILKHARALAAICAPTVNSYKRLVVGRALSGATWAPAYIAYGDNNRTGCVRIPGGRLEMRLPDAGCNPYLVAAAIVAAGMDGVQAPPASGAREQHQPVRGHAGADLKRLASALLPQNLLEAITALEQDEVVQDGLGARARRRVHRAEEDGVDRVRAACVRLGNQPLRGVLLTCAASSDCC